MCGKRCACVCSAYAYLLHPTLSVSEACLGVWIHLHGCVQAHDCALCELLTVITD